MIIQRSTRFTHITRFRRKKKQPKHASTHLQPLLLNPYKNLVTTPMIPNWNMNDHAHESQICKKKT